MTGFYIRATLALKGLNFQSYLDNLFPWLCICDAFHDLAPVIQFKKREKQSWRNVTSRKIAGFDLQLLQPATSLKVALLRGYFSRFLNCTYHTKSRKASYMHMQLTLFSFPNYFRNYTILSYNFSNENFSLHKRDHGSSCFSSYHMIFCPSYDACLFQYTYTVIDIQFSTLSWEFNITTNKKIITIYKTAWPCFWK